MYLKVGVKFCNSSENVPFSIKPLKVRFNCTLFQVDDGLIKKAKLRKLFN